MGKPVFWVGFALFAVFLSNGRMIGSGDTNPARLIPLALYRGDGPYLDRFADVVKEGDHFPQYVTPIRGHLASTYPLGPILISLPFSIPQFALLDLIKPDWEFENRDACLSLVAKNSSAALTALIGVVLFCLCRDLGLGRVALSTTFIATLGSGLWSTASQAPWQHGPSALALVLAIWLLRGAEPSRSQYLFAGLAAAALAAFRPLDVLFSTTLFFWVVRHHPRRLPWFLPFPVLVGLGLVAYNLLCFGDIRGGYALLQGKETHSFFECWDTPLVAGLAGSLLSPNRGLLYFSPWIALVMVTLPKVRHRIGEHSVLCWMLWALIPYLLLLSKYHWWSAGWSFGPRYWTDVIPLFALLLGFGLDWARERARPMLVAYGATATIAFAIQLIGVFCYPSSWNAGPPNFDESQARVWSLADSELHRCLSEGVHPATYCPWSQDAYLSALGVSRLSGEKPRALGRRWWSDRLTR